jgi:hypothetical protein
MAQKKNLARHKAAKHRLSPSEDRSERS